MKDRCTELITHLIDALLPGIRPLAPSGICKAGAALKSVSKDIPYQTDSADFQAALWIGRIAGAMENAADSADASERLQSLQNEAAADARPMRILFISHEYSVWPSFDSVWQACGEETDIRRDLVIAYQWANASDPAKIGAIMKPYLENGLPAVWMEDYCLQREQPDLILYMKPYQGFRACPGRYYINGAEKITPYTAFISYCLDIQGGDTLREYFYRKPFFYHVWKIIGYSSCYRERMTRYGYRNGDNLLALPHPKFDRILAVTDSDSFIRADWQDKIRNRKTILWNTHFSIEPDRFVGSYLQWKDEVLGFFEQHPEYVLLWRPHPLFMEHVTASLGSRETDRLRHMAQASDNIILDESSDYGPSIRMSDALISDASTFLMEYAATGRPVLYTVKNGGEQICDPQYLGSVEKAENPGDVRSFLLRLDTATDAEREKRLANFESIFGKPDGTGGKRILRTLQQEISNDIELKVESILKRIGWES